jgi:hypothetical protein
MTVAAGCSAKMRSPDENPPDFRCWVANLTTSTAAQNQSKSWDRRKSREYRSKSAFGSISIFVNPPLRGPDEIAHFLRIYSYARGELLPVTENQCPQYVGHYRSV